MLKNSLFIAVFEFPSKFITGIRAAIQCLGRHLFTKDRTPLGKFSLLQMATNFEIIQPSGLTGSQPRHFCRDGSLHFIAQFRNPFPDKLRHITAKIFQYYCYKFSTKLQHFAMGMVHRHGMQLCLILKFIQGSVLREYLSIK